MTKQRRGYPVLLDLAEKCCVIVGGGRIAERKVDGLLEADARVTVISPLLTDNLARRFGCGEIDVYCQPYETGLIAVLRPLLVFAATDDLAVNQQVVNDARAIGALVDAVDASNERDFSTMASVRRGAITVGISTDGASPALTKHLRSRVDVLLGSEYATLAAWLDEARSTVIDKVQASSARRDLWRSVLASPILDLLRAGDETAARAAFDALLDKVLA